MNFMVDLSYNAKILLKERYLLKDKEGNIIETPEEMFRRVAKHIASVELLYNKTIDEALDFENKIYEALNNLEFMCASPFLFNSNARTNQLFSCFTLPIHDSLESIFKTLYDSAKIFQSGGGVGCNFSEIRPKNDFVKKIPNGASGPISFMELFDTMCNVMKQSFTRRGAIMSLLNCNHENIYDFITCKNIEGNLSNMNLSIPITDEFMDAVENNKDFNLINPRTSKVTKTIKAKELWNLIIKHSWNNGEPSLIFIDTINKANPTPKEKIISVNPCSEANLLPYESCCLSSINLSKFVSYSKINYEKLREIIKLVIRFLDNAIDINKYPLKEIEEKTKSNRKIGLGVMGWADLLVKLEIKYDSDEALKLAEEVMGFIQKTAKEASIELGKEKGNFPNKENSIYKDIPYMRNATVTSIAPTGSISIIADCSGGIEPIFSLITKRNIESTLGKSLLEINSNVKDILKKEGKWLEIKKALKEASENNSCIKLPSYIYEKISTAQKIAPIWHLKMQSVFQKFVDMAISKTINLPNNATIEEVSEIYIYAYKNGIKGTTVYRDGSRKHQLLVENSGTCPTCPS